LQFEQLTLTRHLPFSTAEKTFHSFLLTDLIILPMEGLQAGLPQKSKSNLMFQIITQDAEK
jgi:hypothetical protein